MTDAVQITALLSGVATAFLASRAYVTVRMAEIRASKATTANEFAMLEKVAAPRRVKAAKADPITPYGL